MNSDLSCPLSSSLPDRGSSMANVSLLNSSVDSTSKEFTSGLQLSVENFDRDTRGARLHQMKPVVVQKSNSCFRHSPSLPISIETRSFQRFDALNNSSKL